MCPCAKKVAEHRAAKATAALYKGSLLFQQPPLFHFFRHDQLLIGKKLGAGGFCQVHQVTLGAGDDDEAEDAQRYAIKFLKKTTMVDKHLYLQGAADLAVEASFLAALSNDSDNKYIVKLRGISDGKVATTAGGFEEREIFVIMDQLEDTLDRRIYQTWKVDQEAHSGVMNSLTRVSQDFQKKRLEALTERLKVALEVAEAMQYLHAWKVVYRDLKPQNVGFDKDGVLKLYDFGLATELKHPPENGKYELTGGAGSIRYMAPEVALGDPYDSSVDVYSFGILLYEVTSLRKPFEGYDANAHMQQVVLAGERPHLPYWFPEALHVLIETCWAQDSAERPPFQEIVEALAPLVEVEREDAPQAASLLKSLSDLSYEVFD